MATTTTRGRLIQQHWCGVRKEGRLRKRLLQHQRALEVFLAVHGQEHPDVASCYQNIAGTYQRQGNEAKATEMCTKAYRIFLKVLGPSPDHPHITVAETFREGRLVVNLSRIEMEYSVAC